MTQKAGGGPRRMSLESWPRDPLPVKLTYDEWGKSLFLIWNEVGREGERTMPQGSLVIHLAADKLWEDADFGGEERKNWRIEFIIGRIISGGNNKVCQQHPGQERRERVESGTDGICQLLNQACQWQRGLCNSSPCSQPSHPIPKTAWQTKASLVAMS